MSDVIHLHYEFCISSAYTSPIIFRFLHLECKDGYFGKKCEMLCRHPSYGKLCQFNCNCTEEDCDHISGCQGTKRRLFSGIFLLENIYWVNRRPLNDFNLYCFPCLMNSLFFKYNTDIYNHLSTHCAPTFHTIYTTSSSIMYRYFCLNVLHD